MKAALDRLTSQPDLNYEAVAGVRFSNFHFLTLTFFLLLKLIN